MYQLSACVVEGDCDLGRPVPIRYSLEYQEADVVSVRNNVQCILKDVFVDDI